MKQFIILLSLLVTLSVAEAAVEVKEFNTPQQEQRYKKLINEFRCVVCQNQNIADSNAALAKDLRKQVYKMVMAGKNDKAIRDFMVTRYGDFVLYNPQFNSMTFLLWAGPFIIFIIGFYVLVSFIRQRKKVVVTHLSHADKEKLAKLLAENKDKAK